MARSRWWRHLASFLAVSTAAALVAAATLAALASSRDAWASLAVGLAVSPLAAALGVFVARRAQPLVGALLAFVGLATSLVVLRGSAWQLLAQSGDASGWAPLVASAEESAWWVLAAVALLFLYFPDGQLPSPRWRWVPGVLVTCTLVNQVYGALDAAPFRPPLANLERPFSAAPSWFELVAIVAFVAFVGMLALVLACVASLLIRYRRGDALRRVQLRWLSLGGLAVAAYPLMCLVEIVVWGRPLWLSGAVGLVGLAAIPLMTAIAILRYDLYDVDRVLANTVKWGLVSAALLLLYVSASTVVGVVLGRDSSLAAALATALGAAAFVPMLRRFQDWVDRRMYPLRRAAYEALGTLQRDVTAGSRAPEELEPVLRLALRDHSLRVGYLLPEGGCYRDARGAPVDADAGCVVELANQPVGVLTTESGLVSPELLREVAQSAATLVEMVRLRLGLGQALREVESSRARLVQIGYDERRRLERDLHDGAQQRLVSLGMAIRLAQRHLHDGTVDTHELLDQSVAELGTAIAELRQIAHGIRPSSLDDGLPAALSRLVSALPVRVNLDIDSAPLPDDVATTAYFVVSEALANTIKHADATTIGLRVYRVDGHVVVRVSDDGRGGATLSHESGLADRVAALGGSLQVKSLVGRGTVVEAALPCAS